MSQRENQGTTEYITDPGRLQNLLTSAEIDILGILPVNQDTLCVRWHFKTEAVQLSTMTNVVVAAFTTAQARLKLFDYLHTLGPRALYYDTDSIMYVSRPGDPELPLGTTLGSLTDELADFGPGTYITKLASGGPKFYAYEFRKPDGTLDYVCKLKGIRLHYGNSQKINFNSVRQMILDEEQGESPSIEVTNPAIRRTAFREILTVTETKKCKLVYEKRRYVGLDKSFPFGFKNGD